MNGIIEIAIVSLIVVVIFTHPAARRWLTGIGKFEFGFAVAVIVFLLLGQVFNNSRTTFPFVRWSMYTEPFEDEPILVCKFEAEFADGSREAINPARLFPSISRNLDQTLGSIFQMHREGKLTAEHDRILDELLVAIGTRYQRSLGASRHRVRAVQAKLRQVIVDDGICCTRDTIVKTASLRDRRIGLAINN